MDDLSGAHASGTITEVEPGRRIVFTWAGRVRRPATGSIDGDHHARTGRGGTSVRLVHSGLTPEQAAGHLEGWNHYGDRLMLAASTATPASMNGPRRSPVTSHGCEASLAVCQAVLRGLKPESGRLRTPCAKYDVDDLVEHLLGSIRSLGVAGGAMMPDPAADLPKSGSRKPPSGPRDMAQAGLEGTVNLGRSRSLPRS